LQGIRIGIDQTNSSSTSQSIYKTLEKPHILRGEEKPERRDMVGRSPSCGKTSKMKNNNIRPEHPIPGPTILGFRITIPPKVASGCHTAVVKIKLLADGQSHVNIHATCDEPQNPARCCAFRCKIMQQVYNSSISTIYTPPRANAGVETVRGKSSQD
jgi:hypothetical protein